MTSRGIGILIAGAAILVQAPRLVLALLAADRQPLGAGAERTLLVLAGIGTALVLTGGNLFLAHTVAHVERWRRALAGTWLAVLVASGALVVPLIVAGLGAHTLPEVLGSARLEWTWSVLAALAHEATAAGCILASAAWARSCEQPAAEPAREPHATTPAHLPAQPPRAPAEPLHPAAESLAVPCRAGCGRSFVSHQAEIAHLRHCPRHRSGIPGAVLEPPHKA